MNSGQIQDGTIKSRFMFLVPSIGAFLFVCLFLILSLMKSNWLLEDGDTGYHIRTGEYILRTHEVPKFDIFSYTVPPMPWTAHEWLSEVVMALVHKVSGLTSIVVFFAAVISLIYYLQFRMLKAGGASPAVNITVVLLAMTSSEVHWLARPHIFTLLFTLIWYWLVNEYQYNGKKYLYATPLLMLLWVNFHGGYIIGFVISGIYLACNALRSLYAEGGEKSIYLEKTKTLAVLTALALLAALANPRGYNILLFPFRVAMNKSIVNNVVEFLSPNFHQSMPFRYMLFLMIAVFAASRRRLDLIEISLVIFFTSMALDAIRYIPLFAIITAPIIAKQADAVLDGSDGLPARFIKNRSMHLSVADKSARGVFWPALAILFVCYLMLTGRIEYGVNAKIRPVAAVEFLKKVDLKGNMFNNDEFGDYIDYVAWPQYKIFFDGRSDMFGEKRMKEYYKVAMIKPGWEDVLKKYDINWIFFDADSIICRHLLVLNDWKLVYADKVADIFVRNTPGNQDIINKYGQAAENALAMINRQSGAPSGAK